MIPPFSTTPSAPTKHCVTCERQKAIAVGGIVATGIPSARRAVMFAADSGSVSGELELGRGVM